MKYPALTVAIFACALILQTPNGLAEGNSDGLEYLVVTGSRVDLYINPGVSLTKPADYMVQQISLINDARSEDARIAELEVTVRAILQSAEASAQITVSKGDDVIFPIDPGYLNLEFTEGRRPDTSVTHLLLKVAIKPQENIERTIAEFDSFIDSIEVTGRTLVSRESALSLSIVNPEKYRSDLMRKISKDLKNTMAILGSNYRATVTGLSGAMEWQRASLTEVQLFMAYDYQFEGN